MAAKYSLRITTCTNGLNGTVPFLNIRVTTTLKDIDAGLTGGKVEFVKVLAGGTLGPWKALTAHKLSAGYLAACARAYTPGSRVNPKFEFGLPVGIPTGCYRGEVLMFRAKPLPGGNWTTFRSITLKADGPTAYTGSLA